MFVTVEKNGNTRYNNPLSKSLLQSTCVSKAKRRSASLVIIQSSFALHSLESASTLFGMLDLLDVSNRLRLPFEAVKRGNICKLWLVLNNVGHLHYDYSAPCKPWDIPKDHQDETKLENTRPQKRSNDNMITEGQCLPGGLWALPTASEENMARSKTH